MTPRHPSIAPVPPVLTQISVGHGRVHTARFRDVDAAARHLTARLGTYGLTSRHSVRPDTREWHVLSAAGTVVGTLTETARTVAAGSEVSRG